MFTHTTWQYKVNTMPASKQAFGTRSIEDTIEGDGMGGGYA